MRKSAWYVLLGAAVLAASAAGCGDDDGDVIMPVDAGPGGDSGLGDAGMMADAGPVMCGAAGRVGGACRLGECLDGLTCVEEFRGMGGAPLTFRNFLGWPQAEADDPANPETFVPVATPVPANDVPVTFATGSMCTEQCNVASTSNMCGSCARCSSSIGNDVVGLGAQFFFPIVEGFDPPAYGANTGLCRTTCNFEIDGRGGCPDGYTCDAFTNLCLESCRNDAQCSGTLVITEDGNYATWIVPDTGRTCNTTTGRCDWTQAATSTVGNVCTGQADCTEDVGVCLRGGTCAETQCNRATDTDETTFVCDGGRGVCLGTGGNNGAVCVQGCTTSDDCNPGNACIPLGSTAGSFTGYCLGICDTTMSSASDTLISCGTHGGVQEQCDMPEATADDPDPDGTCRPTCDPNATNTGCEAGEFCEEVDGTDYGFCRLLDSFCFANRRTGENGHDQCSGGQICNGLTVSGTFGRCVDACTAAVPSDVCEGVPTSDRCSTAGSMCSDADTLVTCAPNAQGCLVQTTTTCTEGCDAGACTAAATCDDSAPCIAGRTCAGGNLVICAPDENGCLVESDPIACAEGCDDSGADAVCTVSGTPSSCTDGAVCVAGSSPLAGLCATPCTTANAATVCGTGRTCQVPSGMTSGFCVGT